MLRTDENKITTKNYVNWGHFETRDSPESHNDQKIPVEGIIADS